MICQLCNGLNLPCLTDWCGLFCFGPPVVRIVLLRTLGVPLPLGVAGWQSRSLKLILEMTLQSVDFPPAFIFIIPCCIRASPLESVLDELSSSLLSACCSSPRPFTLLPVVLPPMSLFISCFLAALLPSPLEFELELSSSLLSACSSFPRPLTLLPVVLPPAFLFISCFLPPSLLAFVLDELPSSLLSAFSSLPRPFTLLSVVFPPASLFFSSCSLPALPPSPLEFVLELPSSLLSACCSLSRPFTLLLIVLPPASLFFSSCSLPALPPSPLEFVLELPSSLLSACCSLSRPFTLLLIVLPPASLFFSSCSLPALPPSPLEFVLELPSSLLSACCSFPRPFTLLLVVLPPVFLFFCSCFLPALPPSLLEFVLELPSSLLSACSSLPRPFTLLPVELLSSLVDESPWEPDRWATSADVSDLLLCSPSSGSSSGWVFIRLLASVLFAKSELSGVLFSIAGVTALEVISFSWVLCVKLLSKLPSVSESEDGSTIASPPVSPDLSPVRTPDTAPPLSMFSSLCSDVLVSVGQMFLELSKQYLSTSDVKFCTGISSFSCPDIPPEVWTLFRFLVPFAPVFELRWTFASLLVLSSNDPGSTESPLLFSVFPFLLSLWSSESLVPLSSSWCNFGRLLLLAFLSLPLCLVSVWFFLFRLWCCLSPGKRKQYLWQIMSYHSSPRD